MNFSEFIDTVNSWKQLTLKLNAADNKTKGDVFELITKYYLLSDPKYTTKLKNVWLYKEIPSAIVKKLHLPPTDQGIDLVAETIEGEYWSIQCKYVSDENQKISHRKISTFTSLSFVRAKNIIYGLIATTADDYADLYRGEPSIGFALSDEWNKLDKSFFDFVRAKLVSRQPPKILPLKPRPHQQQAIRNAVTHFISEKNSRGKLIFPCGAGKSLAGYWISEKLKAKSIVVAVPSLALVKQTLEVYLREATANKEDMRWLCVCSDEGIGKNSLREDDIAIHTQDIGIPCVTDIRQIADWLKSNKSHKTVIFTTYQSGRTLGQAAKIAKATFDLAILDEAHKTVGANDKLFSHLLYDDNMKIKRRIFMTATERFYRGSSDDIVSMEDADLFGDTFEHMTFAHAVEANILSDYKIVTLAVSNQDITDAVKKNALFKDGVEARSFAALIALRKAIQKYPIRHAVSFHGSIAKAEAFKADQDVFTRENPDFSPIDTFFVSGKMPTAARSKIIAEFAESPKSLITNAKCLTEGVDVPRIDAVLFADPRRSTVDIVQAVGRALRKTPGKKSGYVILPLFTGDATGETILESDDFKEVIQTLRALASNDERIVEFFRDVSKGNRPRGKLIEFDIDVKGTADITADDLMRDLELRTWNRLAKLNWRPFEEAREFVRGLKFQSASDWRNFSKSQKRPLDIPVAPNEAYKHNGWVSWGDWLGTERIATNKIEYWDFQRARKFVHKLGLKSTEEWQAFCKGLVQNKGHLPPEIPSHARRTYENKGWVSMGDWLGTGFVATNLRKYRSIESSKKFVQKLKIKTITEWQQYCKGMLTGKPPLPPDIPPNPHIAYAKSGWLGLGDWLGTGNVAASKLVYKKYAEARKFARALNLASNQQWRDYCKGAYRNKPKLPEDIPANPDQTYKRFNKWISWGDWLGTGNIAQSLKEYRPFESARKFVQSLKLKNQNEWIAYTKGKLPKKPPLPEDIPASPDRTYKNKGWINLCDWLGTYTIAPHQRTYASFQEARSFAQKLNLGSNNDWRKFCKGELQSNIKRPLNIPSNPDKAYADKGWRGWQDFLGTEYK